MGLAGWDRRRDMVAQADQRCRGDWIPRADVIEVDGKYEISLEVAGLEPGAVQVTVEGDRVRLAGDRCRPARDQVQYHRMERGQGSFVRTFVFPGPIDDTRVTATARDGVVTITVPRQAIEGGREVTIE